MAMRLSGIWFADYLGRAYVPPAVETPIKGNRFQLPAVEFTP